MKHHTTLLLILAVSLSAMPIGAQDAGPYALDTTLGRGPVRSLAWSPNGELLAVGGALGIWLYTPALEDIGLLTGHTKAVYGLAFSPDGSRIASVSHDKTVRIWDVESQTEIHTLEGHTDLGVTVAWSPDGATVVSGSHDGTIRLWTPDTGEALGVLGTHEGWVNDLVFLPNRVHLASVGHDGMLKLWDISSTAAPGESVWAVLAHESGAQAVDRYLSYDAVGNSTDDYQIITAGRDGTLKVWDAENGDLRREIQAHNDVIYDVAWLTDTGTAYTASWDGTVKRYSVVSSDPTFYENMVGHTGTVQRVTWKPAMTISLAVATLGWDDTVRLWDLNGNEVAAQHEHMDFIIALAWDEDALVSVTLDGRANIWDVDSGDLLETTTGRSVEPTLSAASSDGSRRAELDDTGIVRIVDVASGAVIMELPGRANAMAWSPDGSRLAVAQRNGTITIWRAE